MALCIRYAEERQKVRSPFGTPRFGVLAIIVPKIASLLMYRNDANHSSSDIFVYSYETFNAGKNAIELGRNCERTRRF
jgi:hypothetical protein